MKYFILWEKTFVVFKRTMNGLNICVHAEVLFHTNCCFALKFMIILSQPVNTRDISKWYLLFMFWMSFFSNKVWKSSFILPCFNTSCVYCKVSFFRNYPNHQNHQQLLYIIEIWKLSEKSFKKIGLKIKFKNKYILIQTNNEIIIIY